MAVIGLHHVQIACPAGSEDQLRGFYGGVLGLPEVPKPPALAVRGGVWFQAGPALPHRRPRRQPAGDPAALRGQLPWGSRC